MPTNNRRRTIACLLRHINMTHDPNWSSVIACLGAASREKAVLALADLIEPEERTCRMVGDHLTDTAYCSVCGERFDSVAQYMAMVQLPYSVTDYEPEYKDARYCPNCGAKVVVE